MAPRTFGNLTLDFPTGIHTTYNVASRHVHFSISAVQKNMQSDPAAFEAWLLVLKANNAIQTASLCFNPVATNPANYFTNLTSGMQHYMRFLYRLNKFRHQFGEWFSVCQGCRPIVDDFELQFEAIGKLNNPPLSKSKFDPTKGLEHILEKGFVHLPHVRQSAQISFDLFDQLPTGLFHGQVAERNKIFNTGYIDLWGVHNGSELCIFELKEPGNTNIGIISELYFYANYAHDLVFSNAGFSIAPSQRNHRGYQTLLTSQFARVRACFLVNGTHTEFANRQQDIIHLLNTNSSVAFEVRPYNIARTQIQALIPQIAQYYP